MQLLLLKNKKMQKAVKDVNLLIYLSLVVTVTSLQTF